MRSTDRPKAGGVFISVKRRAQAQAQRLLDMAFEKYGSPCLVCRGSVFSCLWLVYEIQGQSWVALGA